MWGKSTDTLHENDSPPAPHLDPDILLVGNARSLLEKPFGKRIDSFPIVLRFNNFIVTGYEKFVGTKTDWWARNETSEIEPRTEQFGKIFLRLQGEDESIYQVGGINLLPELQAQYPAAEIEVIPRSIFTSLIDTYGFVNAPLTGTLVIAHLLQTYQRLHICGFDNLAGSPDTLRHYYSDTNTLEGWTVYHEPDKETVYLNDLVRKGRVVPL